MHLIKITHTTCSRSHHNIKRKQIKHNQTNILKKKKITNKQTQKEKYHK